MKNQSASLGVIGLGTMGRNLLLNIADSGFAVSGYDKDGDKVASLRDESKNYDVTACTNINEFVESLSTPKIALLLVPAGKIVDLVIEDLAPSLNEGDIIIDGGNSFFKDTQRRQGELLAKGIHFIGLGISGGAEGARLGPSMMPGGNHQAYQSVRPMLEAVAAKVEDTPCVAYLGKGAVGHYVKMVHNGIEYGLMELIAETYHILRSALGKSNSMISEVFDEWNNQRLQSYLIQITAAIFKQKDTETEQDLIDVILDASRSKGTGKWTSQDAMDIQSPVSVIDLAVASRDLSAMKEERQKASTLVSTIESNRSVSISQLEEALYFAFIVTYAQGLDQLQKASDEYDFGLDLEKVATIWRGGCIIRADLLELIRKAFADDHQLANLMIDPALSYDLALLRPAVVEVIEVAMAHGITIPAIMTALAYYDGYHTNRLPANLIQAQRDYFGSHTYERVDKEGTFHTKWMH